MTNLILTIAAFVGTNEPPPVWRHTNCLSLVRDGEYHVIKYLEDGKTNEMFFWTGGFRLTVTTNRP